jgi:hypothetical protein
LQEVHLSAIYWGILLGGDGTLVVSTVLIIGGLEESQDVEWSLSRLEKGNV